MRVPPPLAAVCAALLSAGTAAAEPLGGSDLRREITDTTLTGFNQSLWFSEYHAPDGRVLGHNGGVPNEDSCWTVRGDAVCYYYPRNHLNGQMDGSEFCWRLERAGADGYRIKAVGNPGVGIVRREPGNPRNHTDRGRAWTCDALMSDSSPRTAPLSVVAKAP